MSLNKTRAGQLFIISALFVLSAAAKISGAGSVAGDFLLVDIQARETALGAIYTPFYARPGASTENPACLQGIKGNFLMFSHYTSVFSTHYEQVQYDMPVDVSSCAGGYVMYSADDSLYRTNDMGEPVEKIDNYNYVIGGTYTRALNEEYNLGLNIKLAGSKLYNDYSIGIVCDLGLLYRNYENRYVIGAAVDNIGIGTSFFTEKLMYPIVCRAGYGTEVYRYEDEYRISLFVEERMYVNDDQSTETAFGMEASYKKFFTFRYGYIFGKTEGRVATGAGIKINDLYIDYAYQPFFDADNAHRFTVKYVF
jgi:hypothetical protein